MLSEVPSHLRPESEFLLGGILMVMVEILGRKLEGCILPMFAVQIRLSSRNALCVSIKDQS